MTGILVMLPRQLDILTSVCYNGVDGGDMMAAQILGNRLKVARAERELTQGQLAGLVCVTRQTISAIETGLYCPSALLAFRLAEQLEKPVDELFFLKGETP